jgi:hypothetical protein
MKNNKLEVFLGSSSSNDAKFIMQTVSEVLEENDIIPKRWDDPDMFITGKSIIDNLSTIVKNVDAAIFIYAEDDKMWFNDFVVGSPRDNVLFEHGLFAGYLGINKSIIVRYKKPKAPSDLSGIVYIDYNEIQRNTLRTKLKTWKENIIPQCNNWKIKEIFERRNEANSYMNKLWNHPIHSLDIIAFGLKMFRDAQTRIVKEKVRKGLIIRILTPNPESSFIKQREKDERQVEGSIKQTILDLEKWIKDLKGISPNEENVQLKFYNSLPLDFYWRQGNYLFVGPYLYGMISAVNVTYEYPQNSKGYEFYIDYFNNLWNDDDFCKNDYNSFKRQ